MDIRYKGISKKDIMKIQRVHIPKYSILPSLEGTDWQGIGDYELSVIKQLIDEIANQESHNTDIYIICEMAKLYLDTIKDKKCCRTCKWHDDFSWVCFNGESEKRADFTNNDDCCIEWESREDKS